MADTISILSELRSNYCCFYAVDEPYYHALSEAIRALSAERKGHYIGTQYDGYADGCPVYDEWVCSECGCVFEDEEPTYNYCPNCGARMDGEQ